MKHHNKSNEAAEVKNGEVHRSERRGFARSERRLFTRSDHPPVKDFVKRIGVHAKTSKRVELYDNLTQKGVQWQYAI